MNRKGYNLYGGKNEEREREERPARATCSNESTLDSGDRGREEVLSTLGHDVLDWEGNVAIEVFDIEARDWTRGAVLADDWAVRGGRTGTWSGPTRSLYGSIGGKDVLESWSGIVLGLDEVLESPPNKVRLVRVVE